MIFVNFLFTFVKKLISLNLRGLEVSSSCLNKIIQNLTCLTVVNLSHCPGCSDSALENLAKHCPNLKDLNFEWCSQITDHGIEALLRPADVSVAPLKIVYLNVSSTSVTTKSFWMLLNSLPLLNSFSFARIRDTGKSIADRTMFMKVKIGQLQLQHLDVLGTLTGFNQLKLVLESCPNLIELKLTIPSYKNDHAETFSESLKNLSKLRSLHISIDYIPNFEPRPQPFPFERIGSFLQTIGHQLESLNLAGPMEIKLLVVCLYCSSLKQLVLYDCQLVKPFLPSLETPPKEHCKADIGCNIAMFSDFCPLQYIHLEKVEFKDISLHQKQELLYHLLAFLPNLLQLCLKRVPIEEKCLIDILQTSSGAHLEKLMLSCYDNITADTIRAIEESCPHLKRLELFHCWCITLSDIWQINDRLKRNGRKLEVVAPEQNDLILT